VYIQIVFYTLLYNGVRDFLMIMDRKCRKITINEKHEVNYLWVIFYDNIFKVLRCK